jgi:hypothetical protein
MNDEKSDDKGINLTCFECEPMMSSACDGACSPEELSALKKHLANCPSCRRTFSNYMEINRLMKAHIAASCCPPPPDVSHFGRGRKVRRFVRACGKYAALAACIVIFIAGYLTGDYRAAKTAKGDSVSSDFVLTPSMWVSERGDAVKGELTSELSFLANIDQYKAAIGAELRKGKTDWFKVRGLVEAMGELRTDLELLTIHMAYLDICAGRSPSEVADQWGRIGERYSEASLGR